MGIQYAHSSYCIVQLLWFHYPSAEAGFRLGSGSVIFPSKFCFLASNIVCIIHGLSHHLPHVYWMIKCSVDSFSSICLGDTFRLPLFAVKAEDKG